MTEEKDFRVLPPADAFSKGDRHFSELKASVFDTIPRALLEGVGPNTIVNIGDFMHTENEKPPTAPDVSNAPRSELRAERDAYLDARARFVIKLRSTTEASWQMIANLTGLDEALARAVYASATGPLYHVSDSEIVSGFEAGLEALCRRYGVILRHEDSHGMAYLEWSNNPYCAIEVEDTIQKPKLRPEPEPPLPDLPDPLPAAVRAICDEDKK